MKNLKKLLAIVLSIAMTMGVFSTSAFASIPIDDEGNNEQVSATFMDGETALADISKSVTPGEEIMLPSYSKTGYSFGGWKIDNEGTLYAEGDTYTVNSNVTFYAQLTAGKSVASVTIEGSAEKEFPTFEEARTYALTAGETAVTIKLLEDLTVSERLALRSPDSTEDTTARNITFDLNGYTISKSTTINGFFVINGGTTLTLKGGTFDCATYGGYFIYGNKNSNVNIESGTFTNYGSLMSQNITLSIMGGTFDDAHYDIITSDYTIEKDSSTSKYIVVEKTGTDVISLSNGTTTLNFDTVEHMQVALDYYAGSYTQIALLADCTAATRISLPEAKSTSPVTYTLDLAGHTLAYSGTSNGFVLLRAYDSFEINDSVGEGAVTNTGTKSYYFADNKNAGTITVNAGVFTGANSFVYDNSTTTVTLKINASSWNIDPSAYINTDSYEVAQSGDLYVVSASIPAETIWTISDVSTKGTYAQAKEAVSTTDTITIKLLQDCSQDAVWTIASGKSVTLDLNGHTLTSAGQFVDVAGTFTVKDSSDDKAGYITDSATATATFVNIQNGATFTLESGGFANFKTTSSSAQVIKNAGNFYMKGGFISGITTSKRRIVQGNAKTSKMYLSGGEISGNTVGTGYDVFVYNGTCEISGDFMIGGVLGKGSSTGTITITGGWFKTQPTSTWIADGYAWKANTTTHEGYAGYVKETVNVASVSIDGGTATSYTSFDDAIAAAAGITSGSATVTLLADCEKTAKVTTIASGTTVTLDLNGKNLTNTYTNTTLSSTNHRYFTVAGTLNITDSVGGGTMTASAEYTGNASITFCQATGKIYIDSGTFFTGADQTATSNIAFSRATGGTYSVTGGWYTEDSYCATYTAEGYGKVTVSDAPNASAPITVSNTKKTFEYSKNAADATGTVASDTVYYVEGYTSTTTLNAKTNQFTYTNYNFMGWSTDKDADPDSANLIGAGDPIDWQSSTYVTTNTLYAIWKEVSVDMWVCVNTTDNTKGYASIAAAFADGCTDVTLIKNYTERDTISSGSGRLNLNGYNIVPNTADNPTGSALVIKRPISIYNEDAGTITVGGTDYNFGGEGKIEGYAQGTGGAIDASGSDALVKIYGGTFTGDAPNHGTVLTCSSGGQYYIYGGIFTPANSESQISTYYTGSGAIFVLGGVLDGSAQSDVKMAGTWETYSATSGTVGIAGGYFSAVPSPANAAKIGTWDASGGNIVENSSLTLKKAASDSNYPYMVASVNAVAATGDGEIYESFNAALAAVKASENPEIKLCGDVTETATFDYDITVDLNGFNLTSATVGANVEVSFANASSLTDGAISSSGFVYINGNLTTTGVVNQTATAAKVEYVGGTITDTLGATFYGLVALKSGDEMPALTYIDPLSDEKVSLTGTAGAYGTVTYDLGGIYVYYIANNLQYQFAQGDAMLGEATNYSLLDYYNACYESNHDVGVTPSETLDAILADTLVYAHELQLMSGKGTAFNLPDWVDSAKTSETPVASDNVAAVSISAVEPTNYKIMSGSVNVTSQAGLLFKVKASDTSTKVVTLVVTDGIDSTTYNISTTSANVDYDADASELAGAAVYNVRVDKISPVSYGTTYTATLYVKVAGSSETAKAYHAVDYSINSYCQRMYQKTDATTDAVGYTTIGDVALALYNFGKAAIAYQG